MPDPSPKSGIKNRAYAAAHFGLELDGKKDAGLFRSIEGGGAKADVMTYQNGENYDRWRTLGKTKFDDIKAQVGMAMSKPFYDWIKNFFDGKQDRKNGAIVAADFHYKERARREFTEAMIKEIAFPKLDASDKNACFMTVTMAPEEISFKPGTGNSILQPKGMDQQKMWTAANFRFELDGLQDACKRVTKVDAFTIKQTVIEYHHGMRLSPTKTPSQIDWPQLSFYIPEADIAPFAEQFKKRVLQTKREQPKHGAKKTGTIQTYDNGFRPLFSVDFFGSEIVSIAPEKADSSSEDIKLVKIDVMTERMEFSYLRFEVE